MDFLVSPHRLKQILLSYPISNRVHTLVEGRTCLVLIAQITGVALRRRRSGSSPAPRLGERARLAPWALGLGWCAPAPGRRDKRQVSSAQ
jgi:hypothetical protein